MTECHELTWDMVNNRAKMLAQRLKADYPETPLNLYGIPRGGIHAVQAVCPLSGHWNLCQHPATANVFIDDIIDSGKTRAHYQGIYKKPVYALVDKQNHDHHLNGSWVVFPWEAMKGESGPQDAVRRILEYIGENPDRDGLKETPDRVVKSWGELFAGYHDDPANYLKIFEQPDGINQDEMILLKDCPFTSMCEHHMLPFYGVAHVAYIPSRGKILGLSKLARILDVFARRLQVQERLTRQVVNALQGDQGKDSTGLSIGAACMIEAVHTCVCGRGVKKQGSTMVTSALSGVFYQPEVRAEFFSLVRGGLV